jgi:aspartate/methionine/tyrosine aminotransferase
MFSKRTGWERAPNALSLAIEEARRDPRFVDLTISNPTAIGIDPDPELLRSLADPRSLRYEPHPLGLPSARAAVSEYYRRRGVDVDPERIILTATTSEAYTFLFRLLLDPGDRVAVPTPSYPLFSFLAELADVELTHEHYGADAIIVVSPNNPTGLCPTAIERAHLVRDDTPLIADEVFLDYLISSRFGEQTFANEDGALAFTLSGLSKVAGLPQLKLSWIAVSDHPYAEEAIARLEIIADTFLSVSTPVQHALPALLDHAEVFQRALRSRLARNRALLPSHARVGDGGWYAILPLDRDDEEVALQLLTEQRVLVHPGYFFDMETPAIVISLLPDEEAFGRAVASLANAGTGS